MHGPINPIALPAGEILLCLVSLICIAVRGQMRDYKYLCIFLGFRATIDSLLLPFILLSGKQLSVTLAYDLYFYTYWLGYAVESILGLLLIHSIFKLAMAPLDGLKKLGMLVFRWAGSISIAIALGSAFSVHATQFVFITNFVTELQRTQSILTLCLLIFVCFAIRPMGLTFSSRIFGVSLGLGIMATMNLVASAWMSHFHQMYAVISNVSEISTYCVLLMWITYFALPEPKRRMIVLPTTSPFLRWNQISQVLGDNPGFVAVGGIPPELFAPAELEVMRRASIKMAEQPRTELHQIHSA